MLSWRKLGDVDPADLVPARYEAHQAVQWIARAAYAHLPAAADDSQATLAWHPTRRRLESSPFKTADRRIQLSFAFEDLSLSIFSDDQGPLFDIGLIGFADQAIGARLAAGLADLGFDDHDLRRALPYQLPAEVDGACGYGSAGSAARAELARYFENAALKLDRVARRIEGEGVLSAGRVRTWPHHFDIAVLLRFDQHQDPERDRSIGVGLSPGDETYAAPYFYISPWPYPPGDDLPSLPAGGHWHTQGFTAAILPASRMTGSSGQAISDDFLVYGLEAVMDIHAPRP